ncbi:hypothetical protein N9F34_04790 [Alphaproteobacteria bacterium]|nr:hypothetical protein [Alphaproteobacteria bacterium]
MSSIEENGATARPKSWGHWDWDPGVFGIALCTLALVCFIAGIGTDQSNNYLVDDKKVSNGATINVSVPEDRKPVVVYLKQYNSNYSRGQRSYKTSSYVEFEWLPQDGSQPFSVAAEFWYEKGVDREGYRWREASSQLRAPFLVQKAGDYKINIKVEGDQSPLKLWVYTDESSMSETFTDWGWWIVFFGAGFTILTPYRRIKGFGLHKTKLDVDEEDD